MDEVYQKAIEYSTINQTFAIQKKNLKEKIESKLKYGHGGGIFKIDQSLISFVQMLVDRNRITNVILLDLNDNPILIENLADFRDEILDRYTTSLYEYYSQYEIMKKSRKIEKLLDL